ncbi:type II secretion system F family protein [Arthrobacter sp. NPDC090010]|uniref:type II secretion system F family protein n=1 Tax=Arthrobacter sp. NPDC090010 TaxID=3363942 RepID=UPI00380E5DC7
MPAVLGVLLGLGFLLLWSSCWPRHQRSSRTPRPSRMAVVLRDAGVERVTPTALMITSVVWAFTVAVLVLAGTRSLPIALCFGLFAVWLPWATVRWRARRRAAALRQAWPDAVDHLRSAVRAGLSLPEALIQLSHKGPEELRRPLEEFAADYRSGGKFDTSLDRLKSRFADPVADRIVEALRLTRDVGGADLGRLLSTLAEFLRDETRTRGELEARQSWTVNAARLAVAAPWLVLLMMASRHEAVAAFSSPAGVAVLLGGLLVSTVCYRAMLRIAALPSEERVLG